VDRSDRTVAVVGASRDRAKFGNKAVRAYKEAGYTVWPVNPSADEIEGLPVFPDLDSLPSLPHRATIYLPEEAALEALDGLAELEGRYGKRISAVYLNPGVDTDAVLERAIEHDLKAHPVCSIRAIGRTPEEFGDE
jgi:predicted CoA-binding protein